MTKSIKRSVNNWITKQSSKILLFKAGFWEIPYMSNSPEAIIQSMIKMPFTSHKRLNQEIISKLPFIKGSFYYENLEPGLWLIHSNLKYTVNVSYIKTGDNEESENWFLLNLTVFGLKQKVALINDIAYTNNAWIFHKPNTWATNCHFKGAEERNLTFYFHKDWITNQLKENGLFYNSPIRHFFNSKSNYDIWNEQDYLSRPYYEKIIKYFTLSGSGTHRNKEELKPLAYDLLHHFISNYEGNNISLNHFKVNDKTRVSMFKVEKLLLERLTEPFPGLTFLTKEVGVSETSLKVNFKLVFGSSPGQFFQQKQMYFAHDILLKKSIRIKELAEKMGYQNASKFSAAFKKHNNVLPSAIPQQD